MKSSEGLETSNPPDHADVVFLPPLLFGASIGIGFLGRWFVPLAFLPRWLAKGAGTVVVAVTCGLFCWAVYSMLRGGASIPPHNPTTVIITRGPFRFSRNPIYLSMIGFMVGVGLWTNSFWFIGLAALSAWLLSWGVISREERYLERKFGETYLSYQRRVRRWL